MSKTADRIKKMIVDYMSVGADRVTPQSSLIEDVGVDSIDAVGIAMAIEQEFGIEINDLDADEWVTVSDAVAYVEKRAAR